MGCNERVLRFEKSMRRVTTASFSCSRTKVEGLSACRLATCPALKGNGQCRGMLNPGYSAQEVSQRVLCHCSPLNMNCKRSFCSFSFLATIRASSFVHNHRCLLLSRHCFEYHLSLSTALTFGRASLNVCSSSFVGIRPKKRSMSSENCRARAALAMIPRPNRARVRGERELYDLQLRSQSN